jgi:3',5'-cyclic-AMP phosphodiesterase
MLICQLTDLHIRPVGKPALRVVETNMLVARAFAAVAAFRPRPDVVLITGDIAAAGLATEYRQAAELIRRHLVMPVFVIPGNHDRRHVMQAELGHLPGMEGDGVYIQFVVDSFPVRLVMLDTVVPGAHHGELRPEQLGWLDSVLSQAPDKPTMIAMHHPPIACGMPRLDRVNLRDADAFAAVLARHPQVDRVVCGHHHRAIAGRVAHALALVAPSVVHQVALSMDANDPFMFVFEPPAFQLHRWHPEDGFASHTVYVERFPGPYPFIAESDDTE